MMVRQWRPFRIIGENARIYLLANAGAYGLVLIGFGLGLTFPQLSQAQYTRLLSDDSWGRAVDDRAVRGHRIVRSLGSNNGYDARPSERHRLGGSDTATRLR